MTDEGVEPHLFVTPAVIPANARNAWVQREMRV